MTDETQATEVSKQPSDKELNFRALESKYEKQLAAERAAKAEMEKEIQRLAQEAIARQTKEEDEDDDDPYVEKKKLNKKLAKITEDTIKTTHAEVQKVVQQALQEERKNGWLKQNNDFYEVMQHAEKLAQLDPELAETILQMPDNFERQKLVYRNIKAMNLHKSPEKQPSIQDKVDANRRSPYYQPSGMGAPPFAATGDFSPVGQKNAYDKMKELQKRLRG
jgi:superfamily I DNA and/or RNA helicase